MDSTDAGPFATPTRAQRPSSPSNTSPTFQRSSSVTLEPYDSPLKPEPAGSTYASGGQETDLAEEDEDGDLGIRSSRRDKGKGRAVEEDGQRRSMRMAHGEVQIQMGEQTDEVDEAAEERRVQEVRLRIICQRFDGLILTKSTRRISPDGLVLTPNDEPPFDARQNSCTLPSLLLRLSRQPPP